MVEIKNLKVYGLEESMVRSGLPMQTGEPVVRDVNPYWFENNRIKKISDHIKVFNECNNINRKTQNEIKIYDGYSSIITRDNKGKVTGEFFIDDIYVEEVIKYKWNKTSTNYCSSNEVGLLHRFITETKEKDIVVDHINNNTTDNRCANLRKTTIQWNVINKNNLSRENVIGVNYRKDRHKYRAYLTFDRKQINLGSYDTEKEAIVARLKGESKYYKEYSPQLNLFKEYNIDLPKIFHCDVKHVASMSLKDALQGYKRMCNLSGSKIGTGHDTALKGIIVQFDLKYPQYLSMQLQRYHFIDIISSQSKMHCLTRGKFSCNKYVSRYIADELQRYIEIYNETPCYEYFMNCISNCPMGLEMWMGISTNYLQLKTIYKQRKNHKLKEDWGTFCKMIEDLPHSEFITGIKKEASSVNK